MLRLGTQAWELIKIPDLTPRQQPVFSKIDSQNICILGGASPYYSRLSDGIILDGVTGAVVRLINPASDIRFQCFGQSYL